jgi:predicted RNase H-like HicB family nuclease
MPTSAPSIFRWFFGRSRPDPIKQYTVTLDADDDGTFSVYVPDLPGRVSTGTTREDVIECISQFAACLTMASHARDPQSPSRRRA